MRISGNSLCRKPSFRQGPFSETSKPGPCIKYPSLYGDSKRLYLCVWKARNSGIGAGGRGRHQRAVIRSPTSLRNHPARRFSRTSPGRALAANSNCLRPTLTTYAKNKLVRWEKDSSLSTRMRRKPTIVDVYNPCGRVAAIHRVSDKKYSRKPACSRPQRLWLERS